MVVDRANWEMVPLFTTFILRDFLEELSRENEMELFIMKIIFKLQFTLSVSFLYISRLDDENKMNK